MILIGNKCDLADKRAVASERGKAFADSHRIIFLEISAKDSINIDEAFISIAKMQLEKFASTHRTSTSRVGSIEDVKYLLSKGVNVNEND